MENENNPFSSFLAEIEQKPPESKERSLSDEGKSPFLLSFLTELANGIKNNLLSIKNISFLAIDKGDDAEFRKHSYRSVTDEIKKIDSVLNNLLNYININTPIIKSNTIYRTLEEILEANEKQIRDKNIRIINKCEKDLPETFIHDEQMRYILNSILQYAILATPINGGIGFLIKSFDFQNGSPDKKISPERNGGYIEAAIGFSSDKVEPSKDISGNPATEKGETLKLILELVKEILQKNHGTMTFEADKKNQRALITLKFPIERRKVIYYEPITI